MELTSVERETLCLKILANIELQLHPTLGSCWIWQRSKGTLGYGEIWANGSRYRAHRASFGTFNGDFDCKTQRIT